MQARVNNQLLSGKRGGKNCDDEKVLDREKRDRDTLVENHMATKPCLRAMPQICSGLR